MSTVEGNRQIILDNLVLCLDAANAKSYPGTGTSWSDVSKGANTSTLLSSATYDSLNQGSISFNGTTSWVKVEDSTLFQNNANLSVSIWCNFTSLPVNTMSLMGKGAQDGGGVYNRNYFWLHYDNTVNPAMKGIWWEFGDGANNYIQFKHIGFTPTLNTWYNIVATFEPSTPKIYVNGSLAAGSIHASSPTLPTFIAATQNFANTPFSIGAYRNSLLYWFPGKLNLPLLYRKTLSASEVLQNFNATRLRYGV